MCVSFWNLSCRLIVLVPRSDRPEVLIRLPGKALPTTSCSPLTSSTPPTEMTSERAWRMILAARDASPQRLRRLPLTKARAVAGRSSPSLAWRPRPRNESSQLPQLSQPDPPCGVRRLRRMVADLTMMMIAVSETRTAATEVRRRARTGMMGGVAHVVAVADGAARDHREVSEPSLRGLPQPASLSRDATGEEARAVLRIAEAQRIGLHRMIAAPPPAGAMVVPRNKPPPSLGDHAATVAASAAHSDSGIPSSCRTLRFPRGKSWVSWS